MNVENIKKLIAWLKEDQGRHYKMAVWANPLNSEPINLEDVRYEPCNTAMCLGGHIWLATELEKGADPKNISWVGENRIVENGAEWLDIGLDDTDELFLMHGHDQREEFDKLPDQERATIAIQTLENLLETGEVDWNRFFPA